jgi:thioredoxin reductase (NADPH)
VAVIGGGDSACEEALYLAGLCNKVYMIVRRDVFRASKIMAERVQDTDNIEILFEHLPKEVVGNQNVNGVIVHNKKTGEDYKVEIQGFFLAIGHKPNSDVFTEYLETDEVGYIQTLPGSAKTSIDGIFACGDVQDSHYRQAVTAAGSGCMAAMDAERYLSEKGL